MWPRFGIKIGNSTLCIAYVRADSKIEVIANSQGDRTSQACLLWDGRTNEIECGLTAKQKSGLRPKQAVANSLQFLQVDKNGGLTATQLEKAIKQLPCEYNALSHKFKLKYEETNDNDESKLHVHELSAYEVQVHLLRAELELACQYHNDKKKKPIVVLSVPAYYSETARGLLAKAAAEAGFHVAQIVAEPTAGLLAYNLYEPKALPPGKCVLTIKSGGIFSHFALYEVRGELFSLLNEFGPFSIGGDNYTDALVAFICSEFQRKYKLDPQESRRSMAKVRNAAASCKHVLTTMPSTQIYIDSLMDGLDFNMQMSRARFESLIQPVIGNFMQTLQECLNGSIVDVTSIASIVLLGATMQIPKLKAAISTHFPQAEVHASVPSDEVVAVGCARQATFLAQPDEQHFEFRKELRFANEEVLIWHGDDESQKQVLLDKGALIPHRVLLNVPMCKKTDSKEVFHVRSGSNAKAIQVPGIQYNKEKMFCIEAEIVYVEDEQLPIIRLRCGKILKQNKNKKKQKSH